MYLLHVLEGIAAIYAPFVLPILATCLICKLCPNLPRKVVQWMEK